MLEGGSTLLVLPAGSVLPAGLFVLLGYVALVVGSASPFGGLGMR